MSKLSLSIAAACLAGLASCVPPPPVPPPRFQPYPPFAPEEVSPYGSQSDYDSRSDYAPQQTPPPVQPPTATGGYPTAQRTANPDQVLSPYEPYNVIDVAGFKSGQLARDPSNQKIFRIP